MFDFDVVTGPVPEPRHPPQDTTRQPKAPAPRGADDPQRRAGQGSSTSPRP
jgi:hypothetical protein